MRFQKGVSVNAAVTRGVHSDSVHPVEPGFFEGCPAASIAYAWMRAITHGDHEQAWALLDHNLRLAYAQAWILHTLGRDPDDVLAQRLAVDSSTEPAWTTFVRLNGDYWRAAHKSWELRSWNSHYDCETLGSFARVALEIDPPDDNGGVGLGIDAATVVELPPQHFVMHCSDVWRIAGIGQFLTIPGWPPTTQALA